MKINIPDKLEDMIPEDMVSKQVEAFVKRLDDLTLKILNGYFKTNFTREDKEKVIEYFEQKKLKGYKMCLLGFGEEIFLTKDNVEVARIKMSDIDNG